MQHVILRSLHLNYFKGIKKEDIVFDSGENFVYGRNEAGKTTLFDAVWFLFFGKDSTGRSDFSIKTFDKDNKVIEKVDHEVEAVFEINGFEKNFKRIYKELWTKSTNTLSGHTTEYWVDGYPVRTETEYKGIIKEYFTEELFKQLTSPLFFNSMKPDDRRAALISLVPAVTDYEVFASLPGKLKKGKHIQDLEELLGQGKKLELIKQKAALDKKNLKDEKESIPARIDEATRNMPEAYEFDELEEMIVEKKLELAKIDDQIATANDEVAKKNKSVQDWQNQIFELKTKLRGYEFQADQDLKKFKEEQNLYPNQVQEKIKALNQKGKEAEEDIKLKESQILRFKDQINTLTTLNQKLEQDKSLLVEKWKEENAKTFTWNGTSCTACDRPLEGAQAANAEEKSRARFNSDKAEKLAEIEGKGLEIKKKIEGNKKDIESYTETVRLYSIQLEESRVQLQESKDDLVNLETALNEWYQNPKEGKNASDFLPKEAIAIKNTIDKLESESPKIEQADITSLIQEKGAVQTALEGLQKALGHKETIAKTNARIQELKDREQALADLISDQEGLEYACLEYNKARMDLMENAINSKFSVVRFKMFERLLNGSEREICECLKDGVPFQDLNTAGKIQAGLDIINAFSNHFELCLPVFIDNRESVHDIPAMRSQVINLIASASDKKIRVESKSNLITA